MTFLFRHLLLLGVIFGLAGQGVAYASSPCAEMAKTQMSSMTHADTTAQASAMAQMPDCGNCDHDTDKNSTPCKHMTLGCFAMSGCGALVALDVQLPVVRKPIAAASAPLRRATPVLLGRNTLPELDPPSLLG